MPDTQYGVRQRILADKGSIRLTVNTSGTIHVGRGYIGCKVVVVLEERAQARWKCRICRELWWTLSHLANHMLTRHPAEYHQWCDDMHAVGLQPPGGGP